MKQKITSLLKYFILVLFIVVPVKVDALKCTYEVFVPNFEKEKRELNISIKQSQNENVTLRIYVDQNLDEEVVFTDPTATIPGGILFPGTTYMSMWSWGFSDDFVELYKQDAVKNGEAICPDIIIAQGTSLGGEAPEGQTDAIQIFPPTHSVANDEIHFNISASKSQKEEGDNLDSVTLLDSCTITAPVLRADNGSGTEAESMEVSFFIYSNNTKYWSINNSAKKHLTDKDFEIQLDSYEQARINSNLLNQIFPGEYQLVCPETLYVCQRGGEGDQINFISYDMSLTQACYEQTRIEGANLDGLNQAIECDGLFANREEEGSVWWLLQTLLNYIKILGPILVVILSAVDFIKAVASSDEDAMKKAQHRLVIRLIAALALFLIPTFVQLILDLIGGLSDPTCLLK